MDTHSIALQAPADNPSARPRDARWLLVSLPDSPHSLIGATFREPESRGAVQRPTGGGWPSPSV